MSILDHAPVMRIFWDGRHGVVVGPNGRRVLTEKPALGFRFAEMDYAPAVCCQVRREAWHAIDDMRPDEREACARYLMQVRPDVPMDCNTGEQSGPILPTRSPC